jgi:hypothetical protein
MITTNSLNPPGYDNDHRGAGVQAAISNPLSSFLFDSDDGQGMKWIAFFRSSLYKQEADIFS